MFIVFMIMMLAYLGATAYNMPKGVDKEDWTTFKNFENIATGALTLIMMIVFLFVAIFSICSISCRTALLCNICLSLWTLVFGVLFLTTGVLILAWYDDLKGMACQSEIQAEFKSYFDFFVDSTMCSYECPCVDFDFTYGGWDSRTDEWKAELKKFGRQCRNDGTINGCNDPKLISLATVKDVTPAILKKKVVEKE